LIWREKTAWITWPHGGPIRCVWTIIAWDLALPAKGYFTHLVHAELNEKWTMKN
jgi:hypothetical protein